MAGIGFFSIRAIKGLRKGNETGDLEWRKTIRGGLGNREYCHGVREEKSVWFLFVEFPPGDSIDSF